MQAKEDVRLERMLQVADLLDVPLDHIVKHMGYCEEAKFFAFSDNPSSLPRYIKSSVNP